MCAIGAVVKAGMQSEPPISKPGVSMFIEGLAFKGSQSFPGRALQHEFEKIGALVSTFSDRESMIFSVEVLRENMPTAMELLAETIRVRILLSSVF